MECPRLDCEDPISIVIALEKTEAMLGDMHKALSEFNKMSLKHWLGLVDNTKTTAQSLQKAILAQGLHRFLNDLGSTLLNIASISSNVDEYVKDPKKLGSKKFRDVVDNVDALYESLKDAEDYLATMEKTAGREGHTPIGDLTPNILGLREEINNYKSHVSDTKTVIEEAYKNNQDWRKTLRSSKARAALGQIAGRVLKIHSEEKFKEREKRVKSMLDGIKSTDKVAAKAAYNLSIVQYRRYKIQDALETVEQARAAMYACAKKTKCELKIDDTDTSIRKFNFTLNDKDTYREAMVHLLGELDIMRQQLSQPLPNLVECEKPKEKLVGQERCIRIFSEVPSAPSEKFKRNVDKRFFIPPPHSYDKIPYHVTKPVLTSVTREKNEKAVLAGNCEGTDSFRVDSILFVRIVTSSGVVNQFFLGVANRVLYKNKELKNLQRGFTQKPFDLTRYIPAGSETKISIYALDYGATGYVSDLFLVFKNDYFILRVTTLTAAEPNEAKMDASLQVYAAINGDLTTKLEMDTKADDYELGDKNTFDLEFEYPLEKIKYVLLDVEGHDEWLMKSISFKFIKGDKVSPPVTFNKPIWFSADEDDMGEYGAIKSKKFYVPQMEIEKN
ncbi:MAG: hypothetical protein ACYTBV_18195 [Planctomycetota bacterium]|jgi:hypothetical protein